MSGRVLLLAFLAFCVIVNAQIQLLESTDPFPAGETRIQNVLAKPTGSGAVGDPIAVDPTRTYAVVGLPADNRALVMQRDSTTGNWATLEILSPDNEANSVEFGRTVAITFQNGTNFIIVCDPEYTPDPGSFVDSRGVCYSFEQVGNSFKTAGTTQTIIPWAVSTGVTANVPVVKDFGASISVYDKTWVVGAPSSTNVNAGITYTNAGAVCVYNFNDATRTWVWQRTLRETAGLAADQFLGAAVHIDSSDGTAANTAILAGIPGFNEGRGAASSFRLSDGNRRRRYLFAGNAGDGFGSSVRISVSGPYAYFGVPGADAFGHTNVGAVARSPSNPFPSTVQTTNLGTVDLIGSPIEGDNYAFGSRLAFVGDQVVATAPGVGSAYWWSAVTAPSASTISVEVVADGTTEVGLFSSLHSLVTEDGSILLATTSQNAVWIGYAGCASGLYGSKCLPCPDDEFCVDCDDNVDGDGTCSSCSGDRSGAVCDIVCPRTRCSACNVDNNCTACNAELAGPTCEIPCPMQCSDNTTFCSTDVDGDGTCADGGCDIGYWGPQCASCPEECAGGQTGGFCNDGSTVDGTKRLNDGTCLACDDVEQWGSKCEETCSSNCLNVSSPTCDSGPDGTGACFVCFSYQYGPDCTNCSSGCSFRCDSGPLGTGKCLNETDGFKGCTSDTLYGEFCDMECSSNCENVTTDGPVCDYGISGTGHCLACAPRSYGNFCSDCPCDIDSACVEGLSGDGTCFGNCSADRWGVNCEPCPTGCGICFDTRNGNGTCETCATDTLYGTYCNMTCNANCDGCDFGPEGTGKCTDCDTNQQWGPDCTGVCSPLCSVCSDGPDGFGNCTACPTNVLGPLCDIPCNTACLAVGGTLCDDDIDGTGKCLDCPDRKYGDQCAGTCSSLCATCDEGPDGDGNCTQCPVNKAGALCDITCPIGCDDVLGRCDGVSGGGACLDCDADFGGANCSVPCPEGCRTGLAGSPSCFTGLNGDGTCEECGTGYWGPTCIKCKCATGCNDTIDGDGVCESCPTGFFGEKCEGECPTNCLTCLDDVDGNGTCTQCADGYFGTDCTGVANCLPGQCTGCTIDGNGICNTGDCPDRRYGLFCENECSENCGTCNDTTTGDGACLTCSSTNSYSSECLPCECKPENGVCDSGENGSGNCTSCTNGYMGVNCEMQCSNCFVDGLNGGICDRNTGDCTSCQSGWWGADCSNDCDANCVGGVCDSTNGTCDSCSSSRWGDLCENLCPVDCATNCRRSDGKCNDCAGGRFNPSCNQTCSSNCATCDDGPDGTGSCTSCGANRWGPLCNLCPLACPTACNAGFPGNGNCTTCQSADSAGGQCELTCPEGCSNLIVPGSCSASPSGDGSCIECLPGFAGLNCQNACPSTCDTCSEGLQGTALCTACPAGFYGTSCTACACQAGETCSDTVDGDGSCTPPPMPSPAAMVEPSPAVPDVEPSPVPVEPSPAVPDVEPSPMPVEPSPTMIEPEPAPAMPVQPSAVVVPSPVRPPSVLPTPPVDGATAMGPVFAVLLLCALLAL